MVTEKQYTEAMERHGTDKFTQADEQVQSKWLAQRREEAVGPVADVSPTPSNTGEPKPQS
jgi:hypothetical protein